MNHEDLNHWSKRAADWATGYHAGLRDRPVRAALIPGAIAAQLPAAAPEAPEPMETIFADFERIVPGGMTHWQHPRCRPWPTRSGAPRVCPHPKGFPCCSCNDAKRPMPC